jgi:diguanylate cyclase
VLAILVAAYAAHEDLGLGGPGTDAFFDQWLNGFLLWTAAAICLVGALRATRSRTAWVLVAAGLASWAIGDTIWSIRFGGASNPPLTSISDVFWLAWYPLVLAALALLVRDRVPAFELHRWIDGVAVMLVVSIPWVALFLAPVADHSSASPFAHAVDLAYPMGDAIVFGATLGVYALMAWRPGRMWLALGCGLAVMGVADAIYSVQALGHSYHQAGVYDAAWAGGALLVAYASWEPHPGRLEPREVRGWPAIALPLAAQGLAASIQIYGFFYEIPRSERILTLIVLLIAMVQIVVTRPRD